MTIGYLTSDLITSYNCTIWNGIRDVCEQNKVTFLYFSGGIINSPDISQSSRNRIFDLVTINNIDGLIINSATIFHYLNAAEIENFYKRFDGIPIINIGVKFRNYPAVVSDNTSGIREAVIHMIEHHNCRKFGFISGPENNYESKMRLIQFKKVLREHGLDIDQEYIAEGNYYLESGISCMEELLGKKVKIDAVICANDDMAIGAMNKAQESGLVVPNDIAIVGYDDIPDAPNLSIPLTTVKQPIYEQARLACQLLIKYIKTKKKPESIILKSGLIIRRSCGCFSRVVKTAGSIPYKKDIKETQSAVLKSLADNKKEIMLHFRNHADDLNEGADIIYDSLIRYLKNKGREKDLYNVDRLFNKLIVNKQKDFTSWQNLVSELTGRTSEFTRSNQNLSYLSAYFWQQIRVMIQEMSFSSQSYSKLESDFDNALFRQVLGKLVRSFNMEHLMETIEKELPRINVKACYICLYDRKNAAESNVHLRLAYNTGGIKALPANGLVFPDDILIPKEVIDLNPSDYYIVEAIFFEGESLGYILFKTNPQKVLFEELRHQISSAIKGALLTEEVKALLEKQESQNRKLEDSNRSLKEKQQKILAIEKMITMDKLTSLSRLTAGLAHELNTPLASIRASAMDLNKLISEYDKSAGDSEVSPADHHAIASDMKKSNSLIRKAAERAVGFVQGMKIQTREPKQKKTMDFDPIPVIQDAVLLLNHTVRKNNCTVSVNSRVESVMIHGNEGHFAQVITNLVVNAVDASKAKGGGPVSIDIKTGLSHLTIKISDKGAGIDPEIISRIYDPMFTTKSLADGTGLGLTIVHNIVTGDLNGNINVKSIPGKGSTFTIRFPVAAAGAKNGT